MEEQGFMAVSGVAMDINHHFMGIKDTSVGINIMVAGIIITVADIGTTSAVVINISKAVMDTSEVDIIIPVGGIGEAVIEAAGIIKN